MLVCSSCSQSRIIVPKVALGKPHRAQNFVLKRLHRSNGAASILRRMKLLKTEHGRKLIRLSQRVDE